MKLSLMLAACLLAACGGGDQVDQHSPLNIIAVPSTPQAQWNVSYSDVELIMRECFPNVSSVVFTDVRGGSASLYLWAMNIPVYPYFTMPGDEYPYVVDVGDPATILHNLPNCPQ